MTEDEILRFRTITTLLGHTYAIDKAITDRDFVLDYPNTYKHGTVSKAYRWLANLTDLLLRHHEIIAVTPIADSKSIFIAENEEAIKNSIDPCDLLANNHMKDEYPKLHGQKFPTCQALKAEIHGCVEIGIGHSPGRYLLSRTLVSQNSKGEATEIQCTDLTLGEHSCILLNPIKNTYGPEQTDHSAEHLTLYRYVFISTSGKIWDRVKRGESRTSFLLGRLQTSHESLPSDIKDKEVLETPSHIFENEMSALQSIVNVLSVDPEFDAAPLQAWVDALDDEDPIVYDTRMFQYLLQSAVSRLIDNLKRIINMKASLQLQYVKDRLKDGSDEQRVHDTGTRLDQAADKVVLAAYCMSRLKVENHLRIMLKKNLKWLYGLPFDSSTQALTHLDDPSSDSTGSPSDDSRMLQSQEQFLFDSDPETDEGEEAGTQIYASDFHNIDVSIRNKDLSEAGIKFLNLICLQMVAMENLSFSSRNPVRLKEFILQANLDRVRHYTDEPGKNMMSLNDLLKVIRKDNGEVTNEHEIDDFVKPWLAERHSHLRPHVVNNTPIPALKRDLSKPKKEMTDNELKLARKDFLNLKSYEYDNKLAFSGTSHAESHLMTATLTKLQGEDFVAKESSPKDNYLLLPPKEAIDATEPVIRILPISKLCCPACFELLKHVQDKQGKKILHPGHDLIWTATTFPPILLREAGVKLLNHAEKELRRRLTKIVLIGKAARRAYSETSSGDESPAPGLDPKPKRDSNSIATSA